MSTTGSRKLKDREIKRLTSECNHLRSEIAALLEHHQQCHPVCLLPRFSLDLQPKQWPETGGQWIQFEIQPPCSLSNPRSSPDWMPFANKIVHNVTTNVRGWKHRPASLTHLGYLTLEESPIGAHVQGGQTRCELSAVGSPEARLAAHACTYALLNHSHQQWKEQFLAIQVVGLSGCAALLPRKKAASYEAMRTYASFNNNRRKQNHGERHLDELRRTIKWIHALLDCLHDSGLGTLAFSLLFLPGEIPSALVMCTDLTAIQRVKQPCPITDPFGKTLGVNKRTYCSTLG